MDLSLQARPVKHEYAPTYPNDRFQS